MSVKKQNLNEFSSSTPDGSEYYIAIVTAEWNHDITGKLKQGACDLLLSANVKPDNILNFDVPGSYELPYAAGVILQNYEVDAVICIGCIIKGETPHFDFISQATAKGCMDVQVHYKRPVIFGVLTTLDIEQALDRSGGKHGNKGAEAAHSALKMIELTKQCIANGDRDPIMDVMTNPLAALLLQNNTPEDPYPYNFEEDDNEDSNESYFKDEPKK